jgi:hypothetical protein
VNDDATAGTGGCKPIAGGLRIMHFFRPVLTSTFAVMALVVLACGSIIISEIFLGIGAGAPVPGATPGARDDAVGYAFVFLWPLVMVMVWLLGTFALVAARARHYAGIWLVACFLACVGFYALLVALSAVFRSSVIIAPTFLIVDACTVYLGWRFIFSRRRTGAPRP